MVRLAGTLSRLYRCRILVIGDFMLDSYTIGKVKRISPEAPVAVVQVERQQNCPGGAGNVALNLAALGAHVEVLGRIGADISGEQLSESLAQENIDVRSLYRQVGYETPLKNRIIAESQQIVRVDYEKVVPLDRELEERIAAKLEKSFANVAAIAISDYGKGFLSHALLMKIMEEAEARRIPVITDPKGVDFGKYRGTTLIKPNLSEAYAAANLPPDASLDDVARKLFQRSEAKMVAITRSEAGIALFKALGERQDFPVRAKEVKDVTGAGDTVLAMLTYGLACHLSIEESVQLANVAAGISIERFGCAKVSLPDLARRLLDSDVANKIFDEEHLFALQEALKDRPFILLGLYSSEGMTTELFRAIQSLARRRQGDIVVYLLDGGEDGSFVDLLASLKEISFIILHNACLQDFYERIKPAEIFILREKELTPCLSETFLSFVNKIIEKPMNKALL